MDQLPIIAERRIQAAVDRGELDDLPGRGKPLEALRDGGLPLEQRVYLQVLERSNVLPREVELLRAAAALRAKVAGAPES